MYDYSRKPYVKVILSKECEAELASYEKLDPALGLGLKECFRRLGLDATEFEGDEGWSIAAVEFLKKKKIPVYRAKDETIMTGLRVLYFPLRGENAIFATGIHDRRDLGNYDGLSKGILRAWDYYVKRKTNAPTS